ncbi:hypothetical protein [Williamsia deligens]|uniref:PT repeat-containing protein n=1 Tax=Williamsia deligens TaxID=321325 RepID=A0ABW3G7M0_9NOCA|nr:hypothetical protein [Williamsia deligens]MCP2194204.1 hypothetical protein [Williamsia deligens]
MAVSGRVVGGTVLAAVTSAALATAIPAVPATAGSFTALDTCAAGSGTVTASVDCRDADKPLVAAALAAAAPEIVNLLGGIGAPPTSTAAVILGDGTARIHGTGLAVGVQTSSIAALGVPGGSADADAVTPLSGAIAGAFARGSARATAVSGVSVALSGSGTAQALAVGGSATALNALGARAVRCVALYATASADGVGSCTSILVVFTAENTAGSPVWTYAVVDPTSFRVTMIGLVPVPEFSRDLVRVSVGGPTGVTVASDVFPGVAPTSAAVSPPPAVTLTARSALGRSAAAHTTPVTTASAPTEPTEPTETVTPHASTTASVTVPTQTETTPSTTASEDSGGAHRKDDDDTTPGFTVRPTTSSTPSASTTPTTPSTSSSSPSASTTSGGSATPSEAAAG